MRLLLDAYRSYLSGLAELRVADPDELIAALESWGLTGEGANPAVAIIDDAARGDRRRTWPTGRGTRQSADPACDAGGRAGGGDRPAARGRPRRPAGPAHAGTQASATAVPARRCGR